MLGAEFGKKLRGRISRRLNGEGDLPGMLLFSATLLALLLLMGWVSPSHAAEMGAGQETLTPKEHAAMVAPAAPPSVPAISITP